MIWDRPRNVSDIWRRGRNRRRRKRLQSRGVSNLTFLSRFILSSLSFPTSFLQDFREVNFVDVINEMVPPLEYSVRACGAEWGGVEIGTFLEIVGRTPPVTFPDTGGGCWTTFAPWKGVILLIMNFRIRGFCIKVPLSRGKVCNSDVTTEPPRSFKRPSAGLGENLGKGVTGEIDSLLITLVM